MPLSGFLAQNLLLFVLFYEVELIPHLLIAIWVEHPAWLRSHEVSHLYSCFWILAAFLGLTWLSGSSTLIESIITLGLPLTQLILLTMLLIGFGIKTWFLAYLVTTPTLRLPTSGDSPGGVLAKLGTYGLVRFGLGCSRKLGRL